MSGHLTFDRIPYEIIGHSFVRISSVSSYVLTKKDLIKIKKNISVNDEKRISDY